LVASLVAGWLLYMPVVLLLLGLAHFMYGMPWPARLGDLVLFVSLGIFGFRSLGLILAAVTNSMQESQLIVQLVFLSMLLLSGATFPFSMFPPWLLALVQ